MMTDLDRYLSRHYLNAEQFAAACDIAVDELEDLIRRELIPSPSYIVSDDALHSYVFGSLPAPGAIAGQYFHPAMAAWVARARHDLAMHGAENAPLRAKRMFEQEFATALLQLDATLHRMPDAFDASGDPIATGLTARLESAWEHFIRGTFGLCVANPVSALEIARKEVLQEKLTAVTNDGTKHTVADADLKLVRELIDRYEAASMPFSPIEYPRSSRKRLVDDLRRVISSST
jgi:Family of unknown function (DUF6058)